MESRFVPAGRVCFGKAIRNLYCYVCSLRLCLAMTVLRLWFCGWSCCLRSSSHAYRPGVHRHCEVARVRLSCTSLLNRSNLLEAGNQAKKGFRIDGIDLSRIVPTGRVCFGKALRNLCCYVCSLRLCFAMTVLRLWFCGWRCCLRSSSHAYRPGVHRHCEVARVRLSCTSLLNRSNLLEAGNPC
jgi:hypothetical protein